MKGLSDIRVVLLETTHPGNIGAAARAMKSMGITDLALVSPVAAFPSAEATARASGADDVLQAASVHADLGAAIADCRLVIGTTARVRSLDWPVTDPRDCGRRAIAAAAHGPVAIVFGRESSGMTNAELEACNLVVRIPTDERFSSLNLAAAVQLLAYEVRVASLAEDARPPAGDDGARPATAGEMDLLFAHLERTLVEIGFLDPDRPRLLMRRLRRLFNRAAPDENEYQILRGILAAAQRAARRRASGRESG